MAAFYFKPLAGAILAAASLGAMAAPANALYGGASLGTQQYQHRVNGVTGNGLKVGLGAQYALTPKLALRAEWERYRPETFNTKPNIDQYTVGVRVAF